ncbi:MAG: twitching motility protein, partial [Nitrospinota bacterium]
MRKPEIDFILTSMLEAYGDVSDLNITTGKNLQVDISGTLSDIPIKPAFDKLTPFQTEIIALNLVGSDRRLCQMLIREGSCDSAYFLKGKARLRVNIFSQRSS